MTGPFIDSEPGDRRARSTFRPLWWIPTAPSNDRQLIGRFAAVPHCDDAETLPARSGPTPTRPGGADDPRCRDGADLQSGASEHVDEIRRTGPV